jgi:DNA-binding NarL/FixJ family response regulator
LKSDPIAQLGIVAADPLRSVGLLAILENLPGVRAIAMDLDAAFEREGLSAVLIDARSTGGMLIETISRLRRERPELKTIAMGEPLDPDHVQAVIGAGAKGYLAETAGEGEIRMAVEVVLDGSVWAPRKVLARLIDAGGVPAATASAEAAAAAESIAGKLTPREREVLQLLMSGGSNRDIGTAMNIDEVTVKAHLGRMLRKTGASNRVELTLRALEEMGEKPGTKSSSRDRRNL